MHKGNGNGNDAKPLPQRFIAIKKDNVKQDFSFSFVTIFPFCGEYLVYCTSKTLSDTDAIMPFQK